MHIEIMPPLCEMSLICEMLLIREMIKYMLQLINMIIDMSFGHVYGMKATIMML